MPLGLMITFVINAVAEHPAGFGDFDGSQAALFFGGRVFVLPLRLRLTAYLRRDRFCLLYMNQFVSEEPSACACAGLILAGSEEDVFTETRLRL